ncbi:MAG TPA: hypothetical protein VF780_00305 [Nitrosospira sp.]
MKQVSLLRNSVAATAFAGIMVVSASNTVHAQTSAQTGATAATQSGAAGQSAPGWNESPLDQRSWLSRIFGSFTSSPAPSPTHGSISGSTSGAAPGPAVPRQAGSSGWSTQKQEYSSGCGHSSADEEDFLCKLGRILWGPDTPQGPNRDMDENVTAGGAGG